MGHLRLNGRILLYLNNLIQNFGYLWIYFLWIIVTGGLFSPYRVPEYMVRVKMLMTLLLLLFFNFIFLDEFFSKFFLFILLGNLPLEIKVVYGQPVIAFFHNLKPVFTTGYILRWWWLLFILLLLFFSIILLLGYFI